MDREAALKNASEPDRNTGPDRNTRLDRNTGPDRNAGLDKNTGSDGNTGPSQNHISCTYVTARYQETDQMGVIHHSVYPIWFEAGRTDWIKMAGMAYSDLERMDIMLPLIELTCAYKSYAKYEDELVIKTCMDKISKTRMSFYYEIYNTADENALIASGNTFHVFTNAGLKPVNMKKHNPGVFEKLENMVQAQ